jgi:hypothetical protein
MARPWTRGGAEAIRPHREDASVASARERAKRASSANGHPAGASRSVAMREGASAVGLAERCPTAPRPSDCGTEASHGERAKRASPVGTKKARLQIASLMVDTFSKVQRVKLLNE